VDLLPRQLASGEAADTPAAASESNRQLLDRLTAAAAGGGPEDLSDLAAALRLLIRAEAGFAAAIAARLSAAPVGPALDACLRQALAGAGAATPTPLAGHGSHNHYWSLNSRYEWIK
jgi:hypothetical protein